MRIKKVSKKRKPRWGTRDEVSPYGTEGVAKFNFSHPSPSTAAGTIATLPLVSTPPDLDTYDLYLLFRDVQSLHSSGGHGRLKTRKTSVTFGIFPPIEPAVTSPTYTLSARHAGGVSFEIAHMSLAFTHGAAEPFFRISLVGKRFPELAQHHIRAYKTLRPGGPAWVLRSLTNCEEPSPLQAEPMTRSLAVRSLPPRRDIIWFHEPDRVLVSKGFGNITVPGGSFLSFIITPVDRRDHLGSATHTLTLKDNCPDGNPYMRLISDARRGEYFHIADLPGKYFDEGKPVPLFAFETDCDGGMAWKIDRGFTPPPAVDCDGCGAPLFVPPKPLSVREIPPEGIVFSCDTDETSFVFCFGTVPASLDRYTSPRKSMFLAALTPEETEAPHPHLTCHQLLVSPKGYQLKRGPIEAVRDFDDDQRDRVNTLWLYMAVSRVARISGLKPPTHLQFYQEFKRAHPLGDGATEDDAIEEQGHEFAALVARCLEEGEEEEG